MRKFLSLSFVAVLLLLSLNGCFNDETTPDTTTETDTTDETVADTPVAEASTFAKWTDNTVDFVPSIPDMKIEADLSNVDNLDMIEWHEDGKPLLAENGFFVATGWDDEFFQVYEDNRYQNYPSFITTDAVLHTYHLYFNYLLKSLEEEELYDLGVEISQEMLDASLDQYEELKGTQWEDAAKRNVGFFAVALNQFDSDAKIPSFVKEDVESDLAAMKAHQGIAVSAVYGEPEYREDFSQYIPRGHYTKSEKLSRYFNALMWYGRMTFRLNSEDETKSALLMLAVLDTDTDILENWERLYEPIGFFVGEPDDLVYYDYQPVARDVFGKLSLENLQAGDLDEFILKAEDLRDPGVNSMPVLGTALAPDEGVEERTEQVKGYRFLGQRFTIDASIFQKLICREVGNKDGTMPCPAEESRMLPNGLDVPAAFGSDLAYKILEEMGETDYEKYPENMNKLVLAINKLSDSKWTENLYWGWMYTLKSLLHVDYSTGYPVFMQNESWKRKELTTFLGSWAELKHDTILYAKQVYAELGGGPMIEERDTRGYVEPNPDLYARLASLTQLTIDGLEQRSILSDDNKDSLTKLSDMLLELRDISVKELENETLTDEQYEFIKAFGGSLEHFWYETFSDKEQENPNLLNDNPAPIIADVATDPNCCVLEVGTGKVEQIFVAFPIEGKLRIGKGSVYSYYEFSWPMDDRLTDEKWRDEVLGDWENPPVRLEWQTHLLLDEN